MFKKLSMAITLLGLVLLLCTPLADAQLGGNIPSPKIWWFAGDSIYPVRAWSDVTLIDTLKCNVLETGVIFSDTIIADSLLQGYNLHILNDALIDSMLSVGDSSYFGGQVTIAGLVWLDSALTLMDSIYVYSNARFAADVIIDTSLVVGDSAYFNGPVTINGLVIMDSTLTINDSLYAANNARFASNAWIDSVLTVGESLYVAGPVSIAGMVTLDSILTVNDSVYIGGNTYINAILFADSIDGHSPIYMMSDVLLDSALYVADSVALNYTSGGTWIGGALVADSSLSVADSSWFSDDLYVGYDLSAQYGLFRTSVAVDTTLWIDSTYIAYDSAYFAKNVTFDNILYADTTTFTTGIRFDTLAYRNIGSLADSVSAQIQGVGLVYGGTGGTWVQGIKAYARVNDPALFSNVAWNIYAGSPGDSLLAGSPGWYLIPDVTTTTVGIADTVWTQYTWTFTRPVYLHHPRSYMLVGTGTAAWWLAGMNHDAAPAKGEPIFGAFFNSVWPFNEWQSTGMDPIVQITCPPTTAFDAVVCDYDETEEKYAVYLREASAYSLDATAIATDYLLGSTGTWITNLSNFISYGTNLMGLITADSTATTDLRVLDDAVIDSMLAVGDSAYFASQVYVDGILYADSINGHSPIYLLDPVTMDSTLTADSIYVRAIAVDTLYGSSPIVVMDSMVVDGAIVGSNARIDGGITPGTHIPELYDGKLSVMEWRGELLEESLTVGSTNDTLDFTVFTMPADARILAVYIDVTEAWDDGGGAIDAATFQMGTAGDYDDILNATSCYTTGLIGDAGGEVAWTAVQGGLLLSTSAPTAVVIRLCITIGQQVRSLTSGEALVTVLYHMM